MINPFQEIVERLSSIEGLLLDIKRSSNSSTTELDAEPYGDFHWLRGICPSIPPSTLRIKSAAGEIPGVIKFGKRVLYDKAAVLNWLRGQTRQPVNATLIEQQANEQISQQLGRKGGVGA